MPKPNIKSLYYITHVDNIASITQRGILSHAQVTSLKVAFTPIYDSEIVNKRQGKKAPSNKSLWEYANLYFQPRNPMMYRVVHEKDKRDIAIIGVKPDILNRQGALVTDGNAANDPTHFYTPQDGFAILEQMWSVIQNDWWNDLDGSKRKIMAECLIPDSISPESIHSIFVADHSVKEKIEKTNQNLKIPVIPESHFFFQPRSATLIGGNISIIDGDMFFSNMQTFTISVNLQGIMGKGLASRTKYQFPDVYVVYQDACRKRTLTATKPYLYKRESSLDQELADLSTPFLTHNSVKWFLLFSTKRKWKESSRLEDIEGGLDWLRTNFRQEGIQSIALPALGCGLGNLDWKDVGPIMCQALTGIGIPVAIYLPREHQVDKKYIQESYLLNRK